MNSILSLYTHLTHPRGDVQADRHCWTNGRPEGTTHQPMGMQEPTVPREREKLLRNIFLQKPVGGGKDATNIKETHYILENY